MDRIKELENKLIDIKKELDEIKKDKNKSEHSFKDGDWIHYQSKDFKASYVIKIKDCSDTKQVGIYLSVYYSSQNTIFHEECSCFFDINSPNFIIRFATDTEIEKALLLFAEHKGFKKGVKYKGTTGDSECLETVILNEMKYSSSIQRHLYDTKNFGFIYYNNNWATIIKDYEIIPGYPVTFNGQTCSIDNTLYYYSNVNELLTNITLINTNGQGNGIKSINVGCNGQFKLTLKDIQNLLDEWGKNNI